MECCFLSNLGKSKGKGKGKKYPTRQTAGSWNGLVLDTS